jgi:hypothetical protein
MAAINKPFTGSGLAKPSGRISVQYAAMGTYYANGTIPTPDYIFNHATVKINETSSIKTYETTAFNGFNFSIKGGTTIEATIDGYIQADDIRPANSTYQSIVTGELYYIAVYAGTLRYEGPARLVSFDGSIGVQDNSLASLKFQFYGIPNAKHFKPLVQPP